MCEIEFMIWDFIAADLEQAHGAATFFVDQGVIKTAPDLDTQILKGWYAKHVRS